MGDDRLCNNDYFILQTSSHYCAYFYEPWGHRSGIIGQRFGKHKIGDKTWEGFFGGLIICIIIAFNFPFLPLTVSLIGAITAMIMELIPIPLDDNFKIPLGSGAIMMMLSTPI